MIEKRLIRCIQCDALALFSPADRSPEYQSLEGGWQTVERDDEAAFMQAHRDHGLEQLHPVEDSAISDADFVEPMKTSYFEATNGRERFVVKRSRESIFDPQAYERVPGNIRRTPMKLQINGNAVCHELERTFSPQCFPKDKIRRFVGQMEEAVRRLRHRDIQRIRFDGPNPSVRSFRLAPGFIDHLLAKTIAYLDEEKRKRLADFLREHLDTPLLTVTTQVKFEITTAPQDPPR